MAHCCHLRCCFCCFYRRHWCCGCRCCHPGYCRCRCCRPRRRRLPPLPSIAVLPAEERRRRSCRLPCLMSVIRVVTKDQRHEQNSRGSGRTGLLLACTRGRLSPCCPPSQLRRQHSATKPGHPLLLAARQPAAQLAGPCCRADEAANVWVCTPEFVGRGNRHLHAELVAAARDAEKHGLQRSAAMLGRHCSAHPTSQNLGDRIRAADAVPPLAACSPAAPAPPARQHLWRRG